MTLKQPGENSSTPFRNAHAQDLDSSDGHEVEDARHTLNRKKEMVRLQRGVVEPPAKKHKK